MSTKTRSVLMAALLSLFLAALLAGCGNNDNGNTNGSGRTDNSASDTGKSSAPKQNASSSDQSAQDTAQGVTDDTIRVGHLGPQTGPVAIYDGVREGIQAYFNYVNDNGGVKDHKLKLIAYDDQYQPSKTVKLIRRLVDQDKVFAILGDIGTPSNSAVKDYLTKKGIPVVMLSSGSSQFVNPPIANYMGASIINYELEARILANYAVNTLNAKKIAIAYQNDDYGSPLGEAAKKAIQKMQGAEVVQEVNFQSGDSDLSSQAQKLKQSNPDAIIAFSVPGPAAKLKQAMYAIGLKKVPYLVSSVGANDRKLFELAGEDVWNGTYSTAVMPVPAESDSKAMQQYKKQFAKYFPDAEASGQSELGWAIGQVFVEALKRTDKLTWDSFLKTFNSFDNWKGSLYAGVTFSENNHYGLTSLFITQARKGGIKKISGTITFDPASGKITLPDQGDGGTEDQASGESNGSADQADKAAAGSGDTAGADTQN